MPVRKLNISLEPDLVPLIDSRGENRSGIISRDLRRYYDGLTRARAELRKSLTPGEISLIIDVTNGTIFDPMSIRMLWAEVEDGIDLNELDKKWEVKGPALVKKLKRLDYPALCALVDASERFWERVTNDEVPPDPEAALEDGK